MKVLYVASEAVPFAKTGGLADVAGTLPQALKEEGVEVRVVMPKYGKIAPEIRNAMEHIYDGELSVAWRQKYIGLDIYTKAEKAFEGVYSFELGNLGEYSFYNYGEGDYDYYDVIDGAVAITKENDTYSISGYIDCSDGNTYNFTFTGAIYDENEPYGLEPVDSKDDVKATKELRNGQLLIIRGGKKYSVLGSSL